MRRLLVLVVMLFVSGCGIEWFPEVNPVPSPPSDVTATPGDSQVTLFWSAVTNASSFNVYWSTTSGVTVANGNKVAGVTSPFTKTGLTNGTTYFFVVTAVNSTGESAPSAEVSATPGVSGFTPTGSLNRARTDHTATLLGNGQVLVAGGQDGTATNVFNSAELFDPATAKFTATGSMHAARYGHGATILSNAGGKVLIVGGIDASGSILKSAEIYDPVAGTFTTTGSMNTARTGFTVTQLSNSKALIVGGVGSNSVPLDTAEIFDLATGTFTLVTGTMTDARSDHSATALANGKVLIAGGSGSSTVLNSAELFDPATGTFTPTGSLNTARTLHVAVLLLPGASNKVLIVGGEDTDQTATASAELFDPATGTFTATGSLNTARELFAATLLFDGRVLVTGGQGASGVLDSAEIFDPGTAKFTALQSAMNAPRESHTATLLGDQSVLIVGGVGPSGALASAELFK